MIIRNAEQVAQAVDEIFSLPALYLTGREHFDYMFPTLEGIQGFQFDGETVSEITEQLNNEMGANFRPGRLFVYYVGRSLKMTEIQDLDELFCRHECWKRGIILSDLPPGRLTIYGFYSN